MNEPPYPIKVGFVEGEFVLMYFVIDLGRHNFDKTVVVFLIFWLCTQINASFTITSFFNSQAELWSNDPNQFVEDEDEETFSYSVRISAQEIILVWAFTVCCYVREDFFFFSSKTIHKPKPICRFRRWRKDLKVRYKNYVMQQIA